MRSFWPRSGLWRHPDFLKLWSAETISQFGSQISGLALPLVAVITLDVSAFQVSALFVIESAPLSSARACGGCSATHTSGPSR